MKFWQNLKQHQYAIAADQLGDQHALAWTNLGYWAYTDNYMSAGRALAQHLVEPLALSTDDVLLDVGCGHGASLQLWQQHYAVAQIYAVERQVALQQHLKQHAPFVKQILTRSWLDLTQQDFEQPFDVVLCIDAAYHHRLADFLAVMTPLLKHKGKLALHLLMLSPRFEQCGYLEQQQCRYLLKAAQVNLDDLLTEAQIMACCQDYGFTQIEIEPMSEQVLAGFARYMATHSAAKGMAGLKIKMTAKLCAKLYQAGWVQYVALRAFR